MLGRAGDTTMQHHVEERERAGSLDNSGSGTWSLARGMELLKVIGLDRLINNPDGGKEKKDKSGGEDEVDSNNTNDEIAKEESGSVPTRSHTLDADDASKDAEVEGVGKPHRRRSSSALFSSPSFIKLEEVVFFWKSDTKTDESEDPYANSAADSFTSPVHNGWLTKQGAIHKTWRKRYFVLNDHLLFYYEGSSSRRPKGVIDLTGCEVMRDMTRGKPHCFQVSHTKNRQQRIFLLHGKEDEDMKVWMQVIKAAIDTRRSAASGLSDASSGSDESGPTGSPLSSAPSSTSTSPLSAKSSLRQILASTDEHSFDEVTSMGKEKEFSPDLHDHDHHHHHQQESLI